MLQYILIKPSPLLKSLTMYTQFNNNLFCLPYEKDTIVSFRIIIICFISWIYKPFFVLIHTNLHWKFGIILHWNPVYPHGNVMDPVILLNKSRWLTFTVLTQIQKDVYLFQINLTSHNGSKNQNFGEHTYCKPKAYRMGVQSLNCACY